MSSTKLKSPKKTITPRSLCLALVRCESEKQIIKLLQKAGYWDDERAWRNYGDAENNYSQIGNQQSRPEAALVEKLFNSVDSVLLSHCLKNGIDPTSSAAPQSIQEAVAKFLGIPNGRLADLTPKQRTQIADNIRFIATGASANPNYIIADKGEGQTAQTLPKTILSLSKSNKLRIPFVQGKYNMGGSGVLKFCGRTGFQLIVTRRNPAIADSSDPTSGDWAFTIVRRFDPKDGAKNSSYKYLAPEGKVMHFPHEALPLLPGKYPEAYGETMESGTFIKVYEYAIGRTLCTNILFDLYNKLSLLMPAIALPVRFMERRKGYKGHTLETTMAGLSVRLDEDRNANIEDGFPSSASITVEGQQMDARIIAFKPKKREKYTTKDGIIFEINGQVHGTLSTSFFSRKAVEMSYLKDSILVLVDCSQLDGRSREDLFMTSRDRMSSCELLRLIEKELEALIKNHQGLKELRARRREEAIKDKLDDAKPLAEVINSVLRKSPSLAHLFGIGQRLANPLKSKSSASQKAFTGVRYPTFFKLSKEYPVTKPKPCPINQKRFRVQFTTDAENEYFTRAQDPGTFKLSVNGSLVAGSSSYSGNLWSGKYDVNITIPKGVKEGDKLLIKSEVSDPTCHESFKDEFYVQITEAIKPSAGGGTKRKNPSSGKPGLSNSHKDQLGLPNVIEVIKEEWAEHGFDECSALKVVSGGKDTYDFFLNRDNVHLLREQKSNTKVEPKIQLARFKYGLVLIGLSMLNEHKKSKAETEIEPIIFEATRSIAPVLLPLIQSMGELTVND